MSDALPTCSVRMLDDDYAVCDTHEKLAVLTCPTFANALWESHATQKSRIADMEAQLREKDEQIAELAKQLEEMHR